MSIGFELCYYGSPKLCLLCLIEGSFDFISELNEPLRSPSS